MILEPVPVRPRPPRSVSALWPPVAATAFFLVLLVWPVLRGMALNHGRLIYPLDDVYTHLAIAKNLVRHGSWAVSAADGFSSASSSLLWPWLLALCFALTGVHVATPLLLNALAAVGAIFYAAAVIRRYSSSGWLNFSTLAAIVFFTPLPAVAATGMEHSLQILVSLVFVDTAVRLLTDEPGPAGRRSRLRLLAAGCALVLIRYEGLFLIAAVGCGLLCRRQWRLGLLLGAVACTPLALFGAYSVHRGWYPLPNSLLIKGNTAPIHGFADLLAYFQSAPTALADNPHVRALCLMMAAALAINLRWRRTLWADVPLWLSITLATLLMQLQFAGFGWFYRYEAYLMASGLLALSLTVATWPTWRETALPHPGGFPSWPLPFAAAVALFAWSACAPLWTRATESVAKIAPAAHNIFDQQYQMALFLKRYYPGKGVMANDIGAIDFLADIRLFDIFGLADIGVLRALRAKTLGHDTVRQLVRRHDPEVIVVYDTWAFLYGGLLPEWTPVGRWAIPQNVVCGSDTVTFYAPDRARVPKLLAALRDFAPRVPAEVTQSGLYRGDRSLLAQTPYGREQDAVGAYYWTDYEATFTSYPAAGTNMAAGQAATLGIVVHPAVANLRIEVIVNEEVVGSFLHSPDQPLTWFRQSFPVRTHADFNTVVLRGEGTPTHYSGDLRLMLFAAREPEWGAAPPAP